MSLILAENLIKQHGNGDAAVLAIRGLSFQIEAREFVGIMGESGAGKSTLLSIMGAMSAPTKGRYLVDGIDVYSLNPDQRADFRREFLGFVFQSFHLVPYLTLAENVMLPLSIIKIKKKQKREAALKALVQVGLEDKADRLPNQISGGEMERAAVARAIVNEPPLLLADEPTGNLDTKTTHEMMALLTQLNQAGMTIVMVTHSHECAGYAQRIMKISDGRQRRSHKESR
ncbi:MAG: ABC transporter ATP-binding protein [Deltaproteobacteria bacterium]|nr:ABC transporter ATP-binding protein [Deltaproteobacteria bacterium]